MVIQDIITCKERHKKSIAMLPMDVSRFRIAAVAILLLAFLSPSTAIDRPTGSTTENVTSTDMPFAFGPSKFLLIPMHSQGMVNINYTLYCTHDNLGYLIQAVNTKPEVAVIPDGNTMLWFIKCGHGTHPDNATEMETVNGSLNVTFRGETIGKSFFYVFSQKTTENPDGELKPLVELTDLQLTPTGVVVTPGTLARNANVSFSQPFPILVVLPVGSLDKYFRILVTVFVILAMLMMGCKTKLDIVKRDLKKPFSPLVGLCCQYICMPLIAFTIAKLAPYRYPIMRLGLFAVGCCPGGGNSNLYAHLLGGDVSLSITMTTVSSFASFGLYPLWMLTLGRTFLPEDSNIEIPFFAVFISILTVTVPLIVGIIFRAKFEQKSKLFCKVMMPVMILMLIAVMVLFIIANDYIWEILSGTEIVAGALLPNSGFIIGGVVAWITRHNWTRIKTIALETGLQNMNIAMLTLIFSIPPPDSNLAVVAAIAAGMMTGAALTPITLVYLIWKKCRERFYKEVPTEEKPSDVRNGTSNNHDVEMKSVNMDDFD